MSYIVVDVEADGPCPGEYSMIILGAVLAQDPSISFYAKLHPISKQWKQEALAVSGFTRTDTMSFDDPWKVMEDFEKWIQQVKNPMFISDNNGFDWQFINYYFWRFLGRNPFGYSSTNLGSLYKGLVKDTWKNFKHLRKTKHTHNPVDDARGNAEALREMHRMGLKINL